MQKKAFTLAEVLITLGIIGVVAALTIPTLVQKYKKSVVETKLAKFYSTVNQALELSQIDNGRVEDWEPLPNHDLEAAKKWFDKYLLAYIKNVNVETNENGRDTNILINFPDGSTLRYYGVPSDLQYYIKNAKKYKVGINFFYFSFIPTQKEAIYPYAWNWKGDMEVLKSNCGGAATGDVGGGAYCTLWIMLNGWKIPKDYPLKF